MKPIALLSIVIACSVAALWQSCTKDKTPRPVNDSTGTPCDPNKVYFQTSIMPLINSNCAKSGCHDAATSQKGITLTSYEGIMSIVQPGDPGDSELIEVTHENDPDDVMPPPPNAPLTAEQKQLIRTWIEQGADNAVCSENAGGCAPSNVSFASDIQPILNANCVGCHSGSTISGGVTLSGHGGVQAVAQTGRLYNAVSQNGLATPMPPGQKLGNCDIERIKVWVEEGAKNN